VSSNELIFESWRNYLNEVLPGSTTRLANVRGRPSKRVTQEPVEKAKQITQKNQPLAVRQRGELTAPQREEVVNALVRTAQQYAVPLERDLIRPEDDIIDVILSVMEALCVVQKMNPIDWQNLSKQARAKMEPLKQNPEELIRFFEGIAQKIEDQGGVDVDCDQITAKDYKQIQ
jgi:ABC-type phosphate/phosphonate transport system substrate-binding protein